MINSICLLRLSALGDVLMVVPLVRRLQALFPGVKLTWIIAEPAYSLVAGLTGVEFIVIKKPQSLVDYWRFYKKMKHRSFDVLLALQASLRANLLYPLIHATRKVGYDRRRANDGHSWFIHESILPGHDHTVDGFLKFADVLATSDNAACWDLPISPVDAAFAAEIIADKPTILINPAASKAERSWCAARYVELIAHIQATWDMNIILIGGPGPSDRALADTILHKVKCGDMVGKTKPRQLLALMGQAQLVICPDTGPSHMANAMGTPVIALHAVTNPDISGPYLFRDKVVNYYPLAVEKLLNKSPEKIAWGTQVHSEGSMALIPASAVIAQVDKELAAMSAKRCH